MLLLEVYFLQNQPLTFNLRDYRFVGLVGVSVLAAVVLWFRFPHSIFKPIAPDLVNNFTEITPGNYLFTQFSVVLKYIQLLLLPINQNVDYDFPISNSLFDPRTLLSLLALLVLVGVAIKLFRTQRLVSLGYFRFQPR